MLAAKRLRMPAPAYCCPVTLPLPAAACATASATTTACDCQCHCLCHYYCLRLPEAGEKRIRHAPSYTQAPALLRLFSSDCDCIACSKCSALSLST